MNSGVPAELAAAHLPGWPIDSDWTAALTSALLDAEFVHLQQRIARERESAAVYPAPEQVFAALARTALQQTRVVILGQDPYHGPGQAMGLSFSVPAGVPHPPSLRNIFTELSNDLNLDRPHDGDLTPWARQGVLLLNTVLTVRQGAAHSHRGIGWERFTDAVIAELGRQPRPIVFLLWGKPAQQKQKLLDARHPVIQSPHPSPLSAYRGFFGSRPFSRANACLRQAGLAEVNWRLP